MPQLYMLLSVPITHVEPRWPETSQGLLTPGHCVGSVLGLGLLSPSKMVGAGYPCPPQTVILPGKTSLHVSTVP